MIAASFPLALRAILSHPFEPIEGIPNFYLATYLRSHHLNGKAKPFLSNTFPRESSAYIFVTCLVLPHALNTIQVGRVRSQLHLKLARPQNARIELFSRQDRWAPNKGTSLHITPTLKLLGAGILHQKQKVLSRSATHVFSPDNQPNHPPLSAPITPRSATNSATIGD